MFTADSEPPNIGPMLHGIGGTLVIPLLRVYTPFRVGGPGANEPE